MGMALLVAALSLSMLPGLAEAAKGKKKKKKGKAEVVRVMTRNVYLGADLGPALQAAGLNELIDAAGEVVNQVDRTNFPWRAKALAAEIAQQKPDVVGLQEAALWRTAPVDVAVLDRATTPPKATEVEYGFIESLMAELEAQKQNYRLVVEKPEFDFEIPVNDQGPPGGLAQADRNARLTMRDAILVREKAGVKTSKPASGTFNSLLRVLVAGAAIDVTRGWTATDVKVRNGPKFRFVNSHFEAFDSHPTTNNTSTGLTVGKGQVRQAQALEMVAPGGPARSKLPVVFLGDFNSDDDTVQQNGDHLAYNSLLQSGFTSISTNNPLGCCLSDPDLVGGSLADFDHQVDHIMTSSPKVFRFKSGAVTGRAPVGGIWPSDHNGVTSVLKVPRDKCKKGKKGKKPKCGKKKGKKKK
jgi:endonuclease/exonuclease/phosphatase family metal-dependent hydrolase